MCDGEEENDVRKGSEKMKERKRKE